MRQEDNLVVFDGSGQIERIMQKMLGNDAQSAFGEIQSMLSDEGMNKLRQEYEVAEKFVREMIRSGNTWYLALTNKWIGEERDFYPCFVKAANAQEVIRKCLDYIEGWWLNFEGQEEAGPSMKLYPPGTFTLDKLPVGHDGRVNPAMYEFQFPIHCYLDGVPKVSNSKKYFVLVLGHSHAFWKRGAGAERYTSLPASEEEYRQDFQNQTFYVHGLWTENTSSNELSSFIETLPEETKEKVIYIPCRNDCNPFLITPLGLFDSSTAIKTLSGTI